MILEATPHSAMEACWTSCTLSPASLTQLLGGEENNTVCFGF